MEKRLVCLLTRDEKNARKSEGSFIRTDDGRILFAYSLFRNTDGDDSSACDIGLLSSSDEGETWQDGGVVVSAELFGVQNVMSCSFIRQQDGRLGLYFLIKEKDGSSTIGRAVSEDGTVFLPQRCVCHMPHGYYIVNNDRLVRGADGRLLAPAACALLPQRGLYASTVLYSEDDGSSFVMPKEQLTLPYRHTRAGMQEPGVLFLPDGTLWLWARTDMGYQYEAFSRDGGQTFTPPEPSVFTSPCSPMQVKRMESGTVYAVYNPIPAYNGRPAEGGATGRTPIVLRRSTDGGVTFGPCHVLGEDKNRAYCYPALTECADGKLLVSFCQGRTGGENPMDAYGLYETGIYKIDPATL